VGGPARRGDRAPVGGPDGQGIISTPVGVSNSSVGEEVTIGEDATNNGEGIAYTVPYSERIAVPAPAVNVTETFRVETDASITASARRLPGRAFSLTAEVGQEPVSGAAVDDDGRATVEFPETAAVANVSVERGAVTGERALESSELEVSMSSMLLFPGLPTAVQVTVSVAGLYWRLTAVVGVVPGVLVGLLAAIAVRLGRLDGRLCPADLGQALDTAR
jgi:hypothetical protein